MCNIFSDLRITCSNLHCANIAISGANPYLLQYVKMLLATRAHCKYAKDVQTAGKSCREGLKV